MSTPSRSIANGPLAIRFASQQAVNYAEEELCAQAWSQILDNARLLASLGASTTQQPAAGNTEPVRPGYAGDVLVEAAINPSVGMSISKDLAGAVESFAWLALESATAWPQQQIRIHTLVVCSAESSGLNQLR